MIVLAQIVLRLLADLAGLVVLSLRRRRSVEAENLFLRRELALYQERGVTPRRVDAATRVSLAVLSRLFDWRNAHWRPRWRDRVIAEHSAQRPTVALLDGAVT